jgi:hypothetical protein
MGTPSSNRDHSVAVNFGPAFPEPALCTRRRSEIVEMVVPPRNHPAVPRGSNLRRTYSVRRKVGDPRTPGRTAIAAVAAGGWCIMRASPQADFS